MPGAIGCKTLRSRLRCSPHPARNAKADRMAANRKPDQSRVIIADEKLTTSIHRPERHPACATRVSQFGGSAAMSPPILILVGCQLLSTGLQGEFQKPILMNARQRDGDPALLMEHVRNTSGRGKVAIVFAKNAPNLGRGSILVVSRGFNDHCHTA